MNVKPIASIALTHPQHEIQWGPDCKSVVCTNRRSGSFTIVDSERLIEGAVVDCNSPWYFSVTVHPVSGTILSAGDGILQAWTLKGESLGEQSWIAPISERDLLGISPRSIQRIQFSDSGSMVVAATSKENVCVTDWNERKFLFRYYETGERMSGLGFHPDGKRVVLTCCYEAGTRILFRQLDNSPDVLDELDPLLIYDEVRPAVFSACGRWMALAHRAVVLYSFPELIETVLPPIPANYLEGTVPLDELWSNVVFLHGSPILLAGAPDGNIYCWSAETGTLVRSWPAHAKDVWYLALSPDGKTLVSTGGDGDQALKFWELAL